MHRPRLLPREGWGDPRPDVCRPKNPYNVRNVATFKCVSQSLEPPCMPAAAIAPTHGHVTLPLASHLPTHLPRHPPSQPPSQPPTFPPTFPTTFPTTHQASHQGAKPPLSLSPRLPMPAGWVARCRRAGLTTQSWHSYPLRACSALGMSSTVGRGCEGGAGWGGGGAHAAEPKPNSDYI